MFIVELINYFAWIKYIYMRTITIQFSAEHELLYFNIEQVYQDSTLVYYVDASDPKYGNWMNFIQCARSRLEQNLKALQHDDYLYFEATRDITAGEELLVWYDECQYSMYMGIPTGYKKRSVDGRSHNIRKFILYRFFSFPALQFLYSNCM